MTLGSAQAGPRIAETARTLFRGRGDLRAVARGLDWASTPLGPVAEWSSSLRTMVRMVMASRQPMLLLWGPEQVQLFNDAYASGASAQRDGASAFGLHGDRAESPLWNAIRPQIAALLTDGESILVEHQHIPVERDDRYADVWWTCSGTPVFDDDGSIGGALVACQETTPRAVDAHQQQRIVEESARAEQAVRNSDARYRALFDSIDAGFCVIEMVHDAEAKPVDYRFMEANPAFVKQSGLVDAVGRTARELVPGLEEHWFEIYNRVATTGEPLRFENGSDEMGRWFDVFAFRVGDPSEHHVAILFTDVSVQRRAEQERELLVAALELERSRLADVFQRAPSFVVVYRGEDQRYEFVNEAYYQLVGHRELLGKPLLEALPEVRGQGFKELLETVRQTGEPWVGRGTPVQLQRTPGAPPETRYLDMVFQSLSESDGTRSGVVAHGSDVTEQVLARREVERLLSESEQARSDAEQARRDAETATLQAEMARADAESANRAKSEFLAVMSHELRTPLNAIGGYASLIEMGIRGPVSDEQRSDLARIKQSQRHLLGLINQVLNYTRVESGTVQYDLADVLVQESLAAAEALIMPQLHAAGLSYTVRDCNPSLRVRADGEKVQQILLNVITNAIKFTKPGGDVRVGCTLRGQWVAIAITDTGVGIAPDKLASVFEPFVQVQTGYTRNNDGVGLGLAISRDLARGMGGELLAESTPGTGSTFTLLLPVVP